MPQSLTTELWLPRPVAEAFAVVSDPGHLAESMPPWFEVRLLGPATVSGTGSLIDYDLRLAGIPLRWRTEITAWEPPHHFAERQARGPFLSWRLRHEFMPRDGGTLVRELMEYRVAGGALADRLVVTPLVARVLGSRAAWLRRRLGPLSDAVAG